MAKLLIQASNGAWCIYHRPAELIPLMVLHRAKQIYNLDSGESVSARIGPMFSTIIGVKKADIPSGVDIETLPEAENVLVFGMSVRGIKFDDTFIG